jgi:RNA polymerase sigma-70 factor (ECF subfamily)
MSTQGVVVANAVRPGAEDLWRAHYPALAGWVAGLSGDRDLGHEIAMESFTRLLSRLRGVEEPKRYHYAVAANLLRDHWRRERVRRSATTRLGNERPPDAPAADPGVRDLVDRLPKRYRSIVLLHYYADLTVADVAAAVGRPAGTVKRELAEARALLHAALEGTR